MPDRKVAPDVLMILRNAARCRWAIFFEAMVPLDDLRIEPFAKRFCSFAARA